MSTNNVQTSDYPTDHEDLRCHTSTTTLVFKNRQADPAEDGLVVTIKALPPSGKVDRYHVDIDLSNYPASSGTVPPVFSLYNLGLQGWKHDLKVDGLVYLDPATGQPTSPPAKPVRWVKNFPHNDASEWSDALPDILRSGAVPNPDPATVGDTPHIPVEANLWFMQSPEALRFRLEIHASGRISVGVKQLHRPVPQNETSHGDVPPTIPPGSSEDNY